MIVHTNSQIIAKCLTLFQVGFSKSGMPGKSKWPASFKFGNSEAKKLKLVPTLDNNMKPKNFPKNCCDQNFPLSQYFCRRAPRDGEGGEYSHALIFDWSFVPYFYLKCPSLCPILTWFVASFNEILTLK